MSNETDTGKEIALELNFVPEWARKPADANPYAHFKGGGESRDRDRGPRRGEPGYRSPRPTDRRPERRFDRAERPAEGSDRGGAPDRRPQGEYEPRPPAGVQVSFVPERQHLSLLVRELHRTRRSYPLMDIAARFLSKPALYLVKVEVRAPQGNLPAPRLMQCKLCHVMALDREALTGHLLGAHLEDVFVREDIQTEPPAGQFAAVLRCRLSGEILGPPNYHGTQERLQEMQRTRFAHLTLDEYRNQLETVRDAALVDKWKEDSRKRTIYKLRGQENAEALNRADAERIFLRDHAGRHVVEGSRFIAPAGAAQKVEDRRLQLAIRDAWQRENRFPFLLSCALRPAFRHMGLFLFKASGITFVTSVHPHAMRNQVLLPQLQAAVDFLQAHPGCTRMQLIAALCPDQPPESAPVQEIIRHLGWLIEKGHVIEFFNGTLAIPHAGGSVKPAAAAPEAPPPATDPAT